RVSTAPAATPITNLFFIYFSSLRERWNGKPGSSSGLRVQRVAQTVAEQVEGQNGDEDRHAGPEHEVRLRVVDDGVREHAAPTGRGRKEPNAEEGQRGLEEDVGRDQQCRVDQDRRNEVRQQFCSKDVAAAGPDAFGRLNELPLPARGGSA